VETREETVSRSPPAVPRTRRSPSEPMSRRSPGRRRAEGNHFSFTTLFRYVGREVALCTGVREREVSTSLTSSVPLTSLHWSPWGPARAERNVRGLPRPSRFSTGAGADDEGLGVGEADSNHVGVNEEGGGRGTRG
jgi:hypothetical protein